MQGLLEPEALDVVYSFILTQGNPRELRTVGQFMNYLPSTVQYHDRR